MFFFFLNGNKFLPFAEDFTEKVRQCNNHGHRFVRLIGLDQPHNGVQRIIKKMRLNLLLKKAQICFSHFPLVFLHLIDQRLHASCHFVKAHCKLSHLILGIRLGSGIKITLSDFLRSLVQLTDRLYNTGNDHHRADCNHNDQHADQHTAHHHKPPDLILQGICDLVHITCLIIDIILDIILDQFRQNVNIIVQLLNILIVSAPGRNTVHNIVHPFFQGINIAKKTLQPQLALRFCGNGCQSGKFAA